MHPLAFLYVSLLFIAWLSFLSYTQVACFGFYIVQYSSKHRDAVVVASGAKADRVPNGIVFTNESTAGLSYAAWTYDAPVTDYQLSMRVDQNKPSEISVAVNSIATGGTQGLLVQMDAPDAAQQVAVSLVLNGLLVSKWQVPYSPSYTLTVQARRYLSQVTITMGRKIMQVSADPASLVSIGKQLTIMGNDGTIVRDIVLQHCA